MSRISETPKGVLETYDWQDVAEDLQERIDRAIKILLDESITYPTAKEWRKHLINVLNGKEMTARELFEELGYKQNCGHIHPEKVESYQFVYTRDDGSPEWIEFRKDKNCKCLYVCPANLTGELYDNRISLEVMKAIIKQMEELGWNEDE